MSSPPSIRILDQETLFRGRIFDLRRSRLALPSGLEQEVVVVEHPGAVCVLAVDDGGRMVLVRQYRHAVGEWLLELPAGRLEANEDPATAARRELEEETGLRARDWTPLRVLIPAPGFCSERLHLFQATGLEEVPGGGLAADPDEEIDVVRLGPREVLGGATADAKTLVAAHWLLDRERRAP